MALNEVLNVAFENEHSLKENVEQRKIERAETQGDRERERPNATEIIIIKFCAHRDVEVLNKLCIVQNWILRNETKRLPITGGTILAHSISRAHIILKIQVRFLSFVKLKQ